MSASYIFIEGYNPPRQERGRATEKKLKEALLRLFAKGLSYDAITNQDILDEANKKSKGKNTVFMQTLYQWFEKGKDTMVSVMAAEFDAILGKEIETFFTDPTHLEKDTRTFVRAFMHVTMQFYRSHKEHFLVWFNPSIPSTLRDPSEDVRQHLIKLGLDFLQKRGIGQRRFLIAPVIYANAVFMRQLSIQLVLDKKGFDLFIDQEMEDELEQLLVRYLEPYFDEQK